MNRKTVLTFLLPLLFAAGASFAQDAPQTGQSYWGFDLGVTGTSYMGNDNFIWPVESNDAIIEKLQSYLRFNSLGTGVGYIIGGKVGIGLSPNWDLEGKLRYLTNYTTATEDHTESNPSPGLANSVHNEYSLHLGNVDFNALLHYKLSNSFYAIGGLSFSDLLSNSWDFNQSITAGNNYADYNSPVLAPSPYSSMSGSGQDISNWLQSSRTAVQLGIGTAQHLSGRTLFDAELMASIPLTGTFSSAGQDAINGWADFFESEGYDVVRPTYPSQFYLSLTVGIRFPFGVYHDNEDYGGASESQAVDEKGDVTLRGTVKNTSGDPLDADMTVVDLTTNQVVAKDRAANGVYSIPVKAPGKYSVTADADGYLFGTAYFQVDANGRILRSRPNIVLQPATTGRTRLLVFFDFNSADLQQSSYPELNRAVRLMKAVPTMEVEIAGYTDSVGSDSYNLDLSQRRAEAVRDYMVNQGVDKTRVTAKGYGEASPISPNSTEQGRADNRRVEFVVTRK